MGPSSSAEALKILVPGSWVLRWQVRVHRCARGRLSKRPRGSLVVTAKGEMAERRESTASTLADRLALRPKEAAAALGLSERKLRQVLPRLPHIRLDGAVLLPVEALRQWLQKQATADSERVDAAVTEILDDLNSQ